MSQQDGFSGRLSVVPLSELLLKLKADKQTGEVSFQTDAGEAKLWQRDGVILDAEMGRLHGSRALDRLLGLRDGGFRFRSCEVTRERAVQETLQELLSRRAKREAEWAQLIKRLPPLDSVVTLDDASLSAKRIELSAQQGRLLKLLDGKRSIAQVIEDYDEDPIEVLRALDVWNSASILSATTPFAPVPSTQRQVSTASGAAQPMGTGVTLTQHKSVPPAPSTVKQYSASNLQNGSDPDKISSNPPPPASVPPPPADPRLPQISSNPPPRGLGQTRLGVPSLSGEPPLRNSATPRGVPAPRGLGHATTQVGVPKISSNPPPFAQATGSLTPQRRSGGTRPGYSAPTPPHGRAGAVEVSPIRSTPPNGGLRGVSGGRGVDVARVTPIGGGRTHVGLPALDALAPQVSAEALQDTEFTAPHAEPTFAQNPETGQFARLGRYEIISRLGRGGMGSVYLGRLRADGGFSRYFAIKVLRASLSKDAEATKMLQNEARIASLLHHPNIVSVIDVGTENGQPYLVMDYVRGCSLARLLRSATSGATPAKIATIMIDCLAGLTAVHRLTDESGSLLGAVHNDISPENLMVGVDGVTRLSDFGVALISGEQSSADPRGKAEYLSPERARGEVPDQRSDVFAAGVVLWNALTGESLFRAGTPEATIKNVLRSTIPRPSEVGKKPPACFDAICAQALAREPSDRYRTVEQMLADLRRVAIANDLLATPGAVGEWARAATSRDVDVERLAKLQAAQRSVGVDPKHGIEEESGKKPIERPPLESQLDAEAIEEPPPSTKERIPTVSYKTQPKKKASRLSIILRWIAVLIALGVLYFSVQTLLNFSETGPTPQHSQTPPGESDIQNQLQLPGTDPAIDLPDLEDPLEAVEPKPEPQPKGKTERSPAKAKTDKPASTLKPSLPARAQSANQAAPVQKSAVNPAAGDPVPAPANAGPTGTPQRLPSDSSESNSAHQAGAQDPVSPVEAAPKPTASLEGTSKPGSKKAEPGLNKVPELF